MKSKFIERIYFSHKARFSSFVILFTIHHGLNTFNGNVVVSFVW